MRTGGRKALSVVAIYAIALHAALWALAGHFANAAPGVDPFSVICHSVAPDAADDRQTPALPGHGPSSVCDHCNLGGAATPPAVPDVVLLTRMAPVRVLGLRHAADLCPHGGRASDPRHARGPPSFA